jgi:hypothetical protein
MRKRVTRPLRKVRQASRVPVKGGRAGTPQNLRDYTLPEGRESPSLERDQNLKNSSLFLLRSPRPKTELIITVESNQTGVKLEPRRKTWLQNAPRSSKSGITKAGRWIQLAVG